MRVSNEMKNRAHVVPFFLFLGILFLGDLLVKVGFQMDNASEPWFRRRPEYLLMLLQIVVIFPLIYYWRKCVDWKIDRTWWIGALAGVLGIGLWILPSYSYVHFGLENELNQPAYFKYLGIVDRSEGFDAKIFQDEPMYYWLAIVLRFMRAVVLVSIVEEVFWRGFLMLSLIHI